MIELKGTTKSIKKQLDMMHGVSKDDVIVCCYFLEDEYKRKWEKPIDKLWHKITPTEIGGIKKSKRKSSKRDIDRFLAEVKHRRLVEQTLTKIANTMDKMNSVAILHDHRIKKLERKVKK